MARCIVLSDIGQIMLKKTRVAVLFGGRSAEHEVSLQSAVNVIAAIDPEKYEAVLIGIDHQGNWYLNNPDKPLLNSPHPAALSFDAQTQQVSFVVSEQQGQLMVIGSNERLAVDVIFPILHGPYGEDGSVQGLARLANVACVGSDILGSAVGMDKDIAKRLLRDAGLEVADFIALRHSQLNAELPNRVTQQLGFPVYVKPANMGSSVGVSKVSSPEALLSCLNKAFEYDTKVMIEAAVTGREIECAVLGNDEPQVSEVIGEIITDDQFYSYDRKYIDEDGAKLQIPADVSATVLNKVQQVALATYRCLEARGMARVDMFLTDDEHVIVNEINTLPGFTAISMYPKLWQASGMSPKALVSELIELALAEHAAKNALKQTEH
ncbi:D-alanine--D-alanine ligase [Celerinatantimonas sp. YJH-8]|uniref:D-alanine--D-alanine ligase n=1 Tax=Celerinatantimonas sp. YJH-8 TaxID=3228714 RepID=UPI0038C3A632